jgi:hypothetical protein
LNGRAGRKKVVHCPVGERYVLISMNEKKRGSREKDRKQGFQRVREEAKGGRRHRSTFPLFSSFILLSTERQK